LNAKTAGVREMKTSAEFIREVRVRVRGEIREGEPMAGHTSFGIGGPADVWAEPRTKEDLFGLLEICVERKVPHMIVGRGTNLLVRDGGIRGVVIRLDKACADVRVRGSLVTAGAAAKLGALSSRAARGGLAGLEFCAGIPGSVGGGLAINAGAWGNSLCRMLASALVYESWRRTTPRPSWNA